MYTIKQVAGLTGVSEAVLRAWESRYRVVTPTRSASRYRLYSDSQVAVLREMAALVEGGVPASRAAATLLSEAEGAAVAERLESVDGGEAAGSSESSARGEWDDGAALLKATSQLDPHALDAAIRAGLAHGFDRFADVWLPHRLQELGDAWVSGGVGVAGEHFASGALMRAMAAQFDAAPPVSVPGRILVGLPTGARHELMLFAFAACLRRLGGDVVYLGADVPVDDWVQAAREHLARAAVVGVTAFQRRASPAQDVVDRLGEIIPPVSVWVGGSRSSEITGAAALPDAPSEAAGILYRSLLAGRA